VFTTPYTVYNDDETEYVQLSTEQKLWGFNKVGETWHAREFCTFEEYWKVELYSIEAEDATYDWVYANYYMV
jgi:hypothetical protein